MDLNFDGGVLEISLDDGSFTDILAAGGSFVQGGYNGSVTIGELNPLDGRRVWTGSSNGYITTIVNLPAAAEGKIVKLRWRMGSGLTVGGVGWRVDSITVVDRVQICSNKSNTLTVVTSTLNPSTFGQPVTITATVSPTEAGAGVPTGNVIFKDGDLTLGTVPLNGFAQASGAAVLPAGSHPIKVEYNGDGDFNPSVSPVLIQTVDKATPAIIWTNPADIDYPTPLGSTQLNATASSMGESVGGTFDYLPVAGTVLAPGSHTLAVTFTPTDTGNFNAPEPANVTLNVKPTYTLNTKLAGTGTGVVSGLGISCGTDCSERYPSSTVNVTLKATAAQGSVFLGWSGDCKGSGPCTVAVNQDHNVTATFVRTSTTGRMTGNGSVFMADGTRVEYEMDLSCNKLARSEKLDIKWKQPVGQKGRFDENGDQSEENHADNKKSEDTQFKLDEVTSVTCYDDAGISEDKPNAGFDTIVGSGIGRVNGKSATIEWMFTDAGEPGSNDTATIVIRQGSVVVSVSGVVKGNNQAHR